MRSSSLLKSLRAKRNINQDELANILKISRQSYNTIENNLNKVDLDTIFKILNSIDANQLEVDEFFNTLKQDYLSCN